MMAIMTELIKRSITSVLLIGSMGGAYLHSSLLFTLILLLIAGFVLLFEWPRLAHFKSSKWRYIGTILYPGLPFAGLIMLNVVYRSHDMLFPLYPFAVAWIADTCGYFVGKLFGRHKVCPSISPGKSWEGLLGSFVGVIVLHLILLPFISIMPFASFIRPFTGLPRNFVLIIFLSLFLTIVAFLGGIFISVLKRRHGLKDAGCLLPGHGGFLDRFDSVLFTVIAVWCLILVYHPYKLYKSQPVPEPKPIASKPVV